MKERILKQFHSQNITEVFKLLSKVQLDQETNNTIVMLKARHRKVNRDFAKGIINYATKNVEEANINNGLLDIINELPSDLKKITSVHPMIWMILGIVLIGGIVFIGTRNNSSPPVSTGDTITTTGNKSPVVIGDSASIIFNNSASPNEKPDEQ